MESDTKIVVAQSVQKHFQTHQQGAESEWIDQDSNGHPYMKPAVQVETQQWHWLPKCNFHIFEFYLLCFQKYVGVLVSPSLKWGYGS